MLVFCEPSMMSFAVQVEQRKRTSKAPKQHLNKKMRTEKPAVTQARKSRFTAMSAKTVGSEDEDANTYQQKRYAAHLASLLSVGLMCTVASMVSNGFQLVCRALISTGADDESLQCS